MREIPLCTRHPCRDSRWSPWQGETGRGLSMAVKSRDPRNKRAPKRRPANKRAAAKKPRNKTAKSGAIEEALAVCAHEVRTRLTGILAISDLLSSCELAERVRRWVDSTQAGGEQSGSLAT